jgi:hypothetical protein
MSDPSTLSCPRPSPVRSGRRGQALILALAILFLLVVLGGIFITLLIRNLQRVTRQGETDEALTLALAGVQYAAQQFRSSPLGADWRPETTEPLWRTPLAPDIDGDGNNTNETNQRLQDPDFQWLDPGSNNGFPYTRIPTGRGRFLLRVTYLPQFRPASAASETAGLADEFDNNSRLLRIEVVGRPGEFDPNDPTFFLQDPTRNRQAQVGIFRSLESYVEVGLVDQLWWVTNLTGERGPAKLGVPPLKNPAYDPTRPLTPDNQDFVQHRSLWLGGIRSNTDLQFLGTNVVRIYPGRGESVRVAGAVSAPPQANRDPTTDFSEVWAMDDTPAGPVGAFVPGDDQEDNPANDTLTFRVPIANSTGAFNTGALQTSGRDTRYMIMDEAHRRNDAIANERSARTAGVPALNRGDATTGKSHWLMLTKESGGTIRTQTGRLVNAGYYGLTDSTLPPTIRAKGLYLGNTDDIQHPDNREAVKDEWLRRNKQLTGWFMNRYTPSVKLPTGGQTRPVAEVVLYVDRATGRPRIRIWRTDPDKSQTNVPGGAGTEPAYFYDLTDGAGGPPTASAGGGTGTLENPTQVRDFDYPENGVLFAEGSIRVRGTIGAPGNPRQLTIVSGGTIYIEGNLRKARPDCFLGLLASDYVALNPTAFQRLQLTGDWLPNPGGNGVIMQQNADADLVVDDYFGLSNAYLHLQHGAMAEDTDSETAVHLFRPRDDSIAPPPWPDWTVDREDFAVNRPDTWPAPPPSPPDYTGGTANQLFYWFRQIPAGSPLSWAETNLQTLLNPNTPNYERKTFYLRNLNNTSGLSKLRLHVGPRDNDILAPNQQPYLLGAIAVVPEDRPLAARVEAVIYASTGSWFVIPPPFHNQDGDDEGPDSRGRLASTGLRSGRTFPVNSGHHPMWNEALNMEIEIVGAVSENFPAEPNDTAAWVSRTWVFDPAYNQTTFPPPAPLPVFRPDIRYSYDPHLRRMVRVKVLRTGQEVVAWAAPGPPPTAMPTLAAVMAQALTVDNSYVVTMPVLPNLPSSAVVYEGSPVQ